MTIADFESVQHGARHEALLRAASRPISSVPTATVSHDDNLGRPTLRPV